MKLTPRQEEVLEAIRGGARSVKAIARELDPPVSPRTAEFHVLKIAACLGADGNPPKMRVILYALGKSRVTD